MTSFLIIFVIFGFSALLTKSAKEQKHRDFKRSRKSNAKLQYDIACGIIEPMAKEYRKQASKLSLDEYAPNKDAVWGGQSLLCYQRAIQEYKLENCLHSSNLEMDWLITIAIACGYSLEENFMSKIYGEEIWENFPTIINEDVVESWKAKYSNHINKGLKDYLITALALKNKILAGDSNYSYKVYRHGETIDKVAQAFGLPTRHEMEIMYRYPYKCLADVVREYTSKILENQGFCFANVNEINPSPTEEQKQRQYAKLSQYEEIELRLKETETLNDKYL